MKIEIDDDTLRMMLDMTAPELQKFIRIIAGKDSVDVGKLDFDDIKSSLPSGIAEEVDISRS